MKGRKKGIRIGIALNVLAATSLFLMLVLSAAPASADPINCSANERFKIVGAITGTTTLIIQDFTPDFNLYNTGQPVTGEGHLGVLVPDGTADFAVTVGGGGLIYPGSWELFDSGKLGDAENLNVLGLTDYEFAALASASAQVGIGIAPTSFTAYNVNLGFYDEGISGISFTSPLPEGTVIVAWVLSTNPGNALIRSPLSESLTVPEPTTLLLLGLGLVGLGLYGRKKRSKGVKD